MHVSSNRYHHMCCGAAAILIFETFTFILFNRASTLHLKQALTYVDTITVFVTENCNKTHEISDKNDK